MKMSAFNTGPYSYFDVRGSRKDVHSAKTALAWLCAGFQEYNFSCTIEPNLNNRNSLYYTSRKLEKGENGTCWFDLSGNIRIVLGSITEKRSDIPGLEVFLDKMAALLDTDRVTTFAGNVFIKGFDAMLVLVQQTGNICIWHLLVNKDGEPISYTDDRVQQIHPMTFKLDKIVNLGSYRHIVGWYREVEYLTGQPSADHNNFKASNLDSPRSRVVLDRFTLSGGQHINAGFSFALARPLRGKPQTLYEK